jgi:hypothetical protein
MFCPKKTPFHVKKRRKEMKDREQGKKTGKFETWGDLRGKETGNDGRKKTGGVMRVKQREPG